jgi:predicted phage terminase large subunit-like protein
MAGDQNQKTVFLNDHRGHMFATSVGGSVTGEGGNVIIVDDPVDPKLAASDTLREKANTWHDATLSSRLNNKKTDAEIIVMQRLHQSDLTGHVLSKTDDPEPWTLLCLEGRATKRHTVVFPVTKTEIVREEGSFLHPEREGELEHRKAQSNLGSMGYQSQYQQDPKIQAGGFFKREWWQRYRELPMNRIRRVQFWDCAEKPGVTTDFSVCATWDEVPTGYYLVDLWVKRVAFPELQSACKDLYQLYKPDAIVIEDKSAGVQLIQNLRSSTHLPIIPYDPGRKDKIVRASGATPTVEARNCYLPSDRPFVELFLSRHEKFPNDDHDDEVDTTSMMVEYFRNGRLTPRIRTL